MKGTIELGKKQNSKQNCTKIHSFIYQKTGSIKRIMQDYLSFSKTNHCRNCRFVLCCENQHTANTIKDTLPVQSS